MLQGLRALKTIRTTSSLPVSHQIRTCTGPSSMTVPYALQFSTDTSATVQEEFFQNTSRRWISNEKDRLHERYTRFRPTELQRIASQILPQGSCPEISKFAEGGFNKVFLLKAANGHELIARIPTPIAGPPRYTTASEVATMNFLRNVLKIPVPRVLSYSISSDNPVGAEYILMERVEGESLSSRWSSLTTHQVADIMTQIADIESQIFEFQFPAFGSLYHANDLDAEPKISVTEDFCIGPLSARQFWHSERSTTEIDRGPWLSPIECISSAARREMAVISRHAKAQPRHTFLLPSKYDIQPSDHTALLSQFLLLAPHLIQPGPLTIPTLRHPDLTLNNILLAPGSTKIASIIDWQDAVVFPRFMQAGYPAFCQHDSSKPQSLKVPSLPDDFDEMDIDEQKEARATFRLEEANLYYTAATGLNNIKHMDVLKLPHFGMRQYLLQQTGYPWDADLINLRAALVGITTPSIWSQISPVACPITFSNEERDAAISESQEWNESEQMLSRIREYLGIDAEGGTEPVNFETAVERNRQFRMEIVRQAEPDEKELAWRNWPYKDKEDDSAPPI